MDCGKFEQDGVVILGATLWTDFNLLGDQTLARLVAQDGMNDFKKIRTTPKYSKFRPLDALHIHSKEKAWLEKELQATAGKKIVIITHHLPSLRSVPERYKKDPISAAYASHLDEFVVSSSAVLWIQAMFTQSVTICLARPWCCATLGAIRMNRRGKQGLSAP